MESNDTKNISQNKTNSDTEINYNYSSFIEQNDHAKKFVSPVVKLNLEVDSKTKESRVIASSTGFSVAYNKQKDVSYIVTNNHFCDKIDSMPLPGRFFYEDSTTMMSTKIQFESGSAKVIALDPDKDLCLLEVEGFVKPTNLVSPDYEIKQMDRIVTVGAPAGIFPVIRTAYISNFYSRDLFPDNMALGSDLLLISDIVFPGQSGSPVYNSQGDVIGVICISLSDGKSHVYGGVAIPYQDIRKFLQNNGINK